MNLQAIRIPSTDPLVYRYQFRQVSNQTTVQEIVALNPDYQFYLDVYGQPIPDSGVAYDAQHQVYVNFGNFSYMHNVSGNVPVVTDTGALTARGKDLSALSIPLIDPAQNPAAHIGGVYYYPTNYAINTNYEPDPTVTKAGLYPTAYPAELNQCTWAYVDWMSTDWINWQASPPVVFSGHDDGIHAAHPHPNSDSAHQDWLDNLKAGLTVNTIDFETGSIDVNGSSSIDGVGFQFTNLGGTGSGILNTDDYLGTSDQCVSGFNTTVGGTKHLRIYPTNTPGATLTLTFPDPIYAFGMYLTGTQLNLGGSLTVTFSDGYADRSFVIPKNGPPNGIGGGVVFWGFVEPVRPILSLVLTIVGINDSFGIDDISYVTGEPTQFLYKAIAGQLPEDNYNWEHGLLSVEATHQKWLTRVKKWKSAELAIAPIGSFQELTLHNGVKVTLENCAGGSFLESSGIYSETPDNNNNMLGIYPYPVSGDLKITYSFAQPVHAFCTSLRGWHSGQFRDIQVTLNCFNGSEQTFTLNDSENDTPSWYAFWGFVDPVRTVTSVVFTYPGIPSQNPGLDIREYRWYMYDVEIATTLESASAVIRYWDAVNAGSVNDAKWIPPANFHGDRFQGFVVIKKDVPRIYGTGPFQDVTDLAYQFHLLNVPKDAVIAGVRIRNHRQFADAHTNSNHQMTGLTVSVGAKLNNVVDTTYYAPPMELMNNAVTDMSQQCSAPFASYAEAEHELVAVFTGQANYAGAGLKDLVAGEVEITFRLVLGSPSWYGVSW